jgi:iron complex transport system ATP-binding protein
MITMSDGKVAADGTLTEVLTPQLLRDCFGVEASVVTDPVTGSPMYIPHSPVFVDEATEVDE